MSQVVEQGSIDPVVRECLQFQIPARVETVNGLDEADSASGDEIVEFDLGTTPMHASREKLHLRDVRKDKICAEGIGRGEILLSWWGRPPKRRPLGGFDRGDSVKAWWTQASNALYADLCDPTSLAPSLAMYWRF